MQLATAGPLKGVTGRNSDEDAVAARWDGICVGVRSVIRVKETKVHSRSRKNPNVFRSARQSSDAQTLRPDASNLFKCRRTVGANPQ